MSEMKVNSIELDAFTGFPLTEQHIGMTFILREIYRTNERGRMMVLQSDVPPPVKPPKSVRGFKAGTRFKRNEKKWIGYTPNGGRWFFEMRCDDFTTELLASLDSQITEFTTTENG